MSRKSILLLNLQDLIAPIRRLKMFRFGVFFHALVFVIDRYKNLASQYKSMYPSLEIDIDGELEKLKVSCHLTDYNLLRQP